MGNLKKVEEIKPRYLILNHYLKKDTSTKKAGDLSHTHNVIAVDKTIEELLSNYFMPTVDTKVREITKEDAKNGRHYWVIDFNDDWSEKIDYDGQENKVKKLVKKVTFDRTLGNISKFKHFLKK